MNVRTLLVLAIAAACGSPQPAATGPSLPAMTHTLVTGATWTRPAGTILVIDVWASWCKPCLKGMVRVEQIASAFPDVAVLGLSIDEDDAAMRLFLADAGVAFPNARVAPAVVEAAPLSVRSLPAIIVADPQGRIRWRAQEMGDDDYDALAAVLSKLRARHVRGQ